MTKPIYQAVDHLIIRLPDIEPLFSLFNNVFGLPVSWPQQSSSFATFGWINVGNTNLELWAAASNSDLPPDCQPPLFHGLALDPCDLSSSISQLLALGIACKTPRPYQTANECGVLVTNFTNSVVIDLSSESCCVFFCAWDKNGSIFPWQEKLTSAQRRARDLATFRRCQGGSLGLIGLSEIELSVPSIVEATAKWQALTGSDSQPIALTDDISLRLVSGERTVIQSLVFQVRSLEITKAFLESRNLLETNSARELMCSTVATGGLKFKFVESDQKQRLHLIHNAKSAREVLP